MTFHKHTFVFMAHLSPNIFKLFSESFSNYFGEQSQLVSLTSQYEHVTGLGTFVVSADEEINRDLMASVIDLAEAIRLKNYYFISNNDSGDTVNPTYLFMRVIKLSEYQETIVKVLKELLATWQMGGRQFGYDVAVFNGNYIRLACYGNRKFPDEMISDVDKIVENFQKMFSLSI